MTRGGVHARGEGVFQRVVRVRAAGQWAVNADPRGRVGLLHALCVSPTSPAS